MIKQIRQRNKEDGGSKMGRITSARLRWRERVKIRKEIERVA